MRTIQVIKCRPESGWLTLGEDGYWHGLDLEKFQSYLLTIFKEMVSEEVGKQKRNYFQVKKEFIDYVKDLNVISSECDNVYSLEDFANDAIKKFEMEQADVN